MVQLSSVLDAFVEECRLAGGVSRRLRGSAGCVIRYPEAGVDVELWIDGSGRRLEAMITDPFGHDIFSCVVEGHPMIYRRGPARLVIMPEDIRCKARRMAGEEMVEYLEITPRGVKVGPPVVV